MTTVAPTENITLRYVRKANNTHITFADMVEEMTLKGTEADDYRVVVEQETVETHASPQEQHRAA